MEIISCEDYNGWFVGKFKPALIRTDEIEFGYKRISKGTRPDYHFHKSKTEYTVLIEGLILLKTNKTIIKPGNICKEAIPLPENKPLALYA